MATLVKDKDKDKEPGDKKLGDSEQAELVCQQLEEELRDLQVHHEQYFLGQERRPPTRERENFKRKLNQLKGMFVRQTAMKFRIGSLSQKYATYERLWERTLQEIEQGIYRRDLFKARMHGSKKKTEPAVKGVGKDSDDFAVDEDLDLSDLDGDLGTALGEAADATTDPLMPAIKSTPVPSVPSIAAAGKPAPTASGANKALPSVPAVKATGPMGVLPLGPKPAQPSAPPPPPPSGAAGGLTDGKIRAIYDAYVMAKRRCGEDTSAISLGSVSDTLKKQVPALLKQHNAKSVEFKVVIKDGKAVLRALPKE